MDVIANAKKHFSDIGVQKIEVPEWGEDGKPALVYWKPITLGERQRFLAAGEKEGMVAAYAEVLVVKALNADGSKMFTIEHKRVFRNDVDPDVVRRVALQMMVVPSVDDMGKDSSRTTSSD